MKFSSIVPNMIRDPKFVSLDGWGFNVVNPVSGMYTWVQVYRNFSFFGDGTLYVSHNDSAAANIAYAYTDLIKSWQVGDTIQVTGDLGGLVTTTIRVQLLALDAAGVIIGTLINNSASYANGLFAFDQTSSAVPAGTVKLRLQFMKDNNSTAFNIYISNFKAKKTNNLSTYKPDTLDLVKLEIAPYPSPSNNKLSNGVRLKGGYQWITPIATSYIDQDTSNWVYHSVSSSLGNYFYTEALPVQPGNWISGRFNGSSNTGHFRTRIEFLTPDYTVVNPDGDFGAASTPFGAAWNNDTLTIAAVQAPANATAFRLKVEMGSTLNAYPYTLAGATISFQMVLLFENTTSTSNTDVTATQWVDLMTSSSDIIINRKALNLGTLTATILDKTLDPLEATSIRPGRLVQMLVYNSVKDRFEPMFSGEADVASVTYDATLLMTAPTANEIAAITLVAVDGQRKLAGSKRPYGVATIPQLPYILEGCGVEWNVDGVVDQIVDPATISKNNSAAALDQVIMTRDSNAGFAWIDKWNKFMARTTLSPNLYADWSFELGTNGSSYGQHGGGAVVFNRVIVDNASSGRYVLKATTLANGNILFIDSLPLSSFIQNDPGSVRFKMRVKPGALLTANRQWKPMLLVTLLIPHWV